MRSLAVALLASLAAITLFVAYPSGVTEADDQAIPIGNLFFCSVQFEDGSCETTIQAGDTVTWTNVAGFHTVTECAAGHDPCPLPGGFDSGEMDQGATYARTFPEAGMFEYYCLFHPSQMRGVILVEAADTPTPVPTAAPSGAPTNQPTSATTAPVSIPKTGGDPGTTPGGDPWLVTIGLAAALLFASGSCAFAGARARA